MATCESIDLITALSKWYGGTKLDAYCIGGFETVWIGRWAKIIAFFAAMPLLIDLAGEERVDAARRKFQYAVVRVIHLLTRREAKFGESIKGISVCIFSVILSILWYSAKLSYLFFSIENQLYISQKTSFLWDVVIAISCAAYIFIGWLYVMATIMKMGRLIWIVRLFGVILIVLAFGLDLIVS